jgi:hypothetical protein
VEEDMLWKKGSKEGQLLWSLFRDFWVLPTDQPKDYYEKYPSFNYDPLKWVSTYVHSKLVDWVIAMVIFPSGVTADIC